MKLKTLEELKRVAEVRPQYYEGPNIIATGP